MHIYPYDIVIGAFAASSFFSLAVLFRHRRVWPISVAVVVTAAVAVVGPPLWWKLTYTPSSFDCPADGILAAMVFLATLACLGPIHLALLLVQIASVYDEETRRPRR